MASVRPVVSADRPPVLAFEDGRIFSTVDNSKSNIVIARTPRQARKRQDAGLGHTVQCSPTTSYNVWRVPRSRRLRDLDEQLPDRLPAGHVQLGLLDAVGGERILVHAELQRAICDEAPDLVVLLQSFLGLLGVVQSPGCNHLSVSVLVTNICAHAIRRKDGNYMTHAV